MSPAQQRACDELLPRYGVAAARFGGLTADDVINAWPLNRLEEFLAQGRSG